MLQRRWRLSQSQPLLDAVDTVAADLEHATARATRRRVGTGLEDAAAAADTSGSPEGEGSAAEVRAIRERSGHSQRGFWPLFGVTQAAGCRYESDDREVPTPVLMLVLGYGEGIISRSLLTDLKELVRRSGKNKKDEDGGC